VGCSQHAANQLGQSASMEALKLPRAVARAYPAGRWRHWLAGYLGPALVLLEVAVVAFRIPKVVLPAPSAVVAQFAENPGWLLLQAVNTTLETVLGFGLALLIGIPLAVAIVYSRFLENTFYTLLVISNSVPKIAVAPLFIIWMGTGTAPKVA